MIDFKKVMYIFNKKQKITFVCLIFITLIGGFVELLGVAAVMPLVNMVVDESVIYTNEIYHFIYQLLGMESSRQFIIVTAIALIFIYIIKNVYVFFMNDLQYRFIYSSQRKLSGYLFESYVRQDYVFHLGHNSSELQRNVLQDVSMFNSVISNALQLLAEVIVCILLIVYLFVMDVTTTVMIAVVVGIFVLGFYFCYKKVLVKWGERYRVLNALNIKWIQQSFGAIKEIKILHREPFFVDVFREQYDKNVDAIYKQKLLGLLPRPLMETMCIGGLLLAVAVKIYSGGDMSTFVPILSVFVVAASRMLPSFNRITSYMNVIMFNKAGVDAVYDELQNVAQMQEGLELNLESIKNYEERPAIEFENSIRVKDLYYRYPETEVDVLKGISLEIPKNKSVAFIGSSGAGKTTLVDVILGILSPLSGEILCDQTNITDNIFSWYDKLGYIPQNIYLIDDTIRNNIALGVHEDEIDEEKVWEALREAQLENDKGFLWKDCYGTGGPADLDGTDG